jgi:hypothetical protein
MENNTTTSLNRKQRVDPLSVGSVEFSCLKIVPLDNKNLNESVFDQSLELTFKPPFFSIFLGPSRSGKTTTWMNFLKNPQLLFKRFHEIHYFIPTWNEDSIYENNIKTEKKYVYTVFDPKVFEDMIEERKQLVNAYKKVHGDDCEIENILPRTLILVDDNIGTRSLSGHVYSMLDTLATKGRKFNISTILTIQYLRTVASRIVRGNATDICIFYLPDADEQKMVLTEFQGSVTKEDILSMYRSCFQTTQDKWNFFYIQNFNTNVFNKFRKNLSTVLIPPSLINQFKSSYPEWAVKVAGQNLQGDSKVLSPPLNAASSKPKEPPTGLLSGVSVKEKHHSAQSKRKRTHPYKTTNRNKNNHDL